MHKKTLSVFAFALVFFLSLTNNTHALVDPGKVDIHGFLSQGYLDTTGNDWMGETKDGTWEFRELGLNFTSLVSPRLRLGMQLFARDLAAIGNDEIVLDWAYADYNFREWLGIRAGQIKNPQGLYSETRDLDFLRISTFVSQMLYNEAARDSYLTTKGIGLYGIIEAGPAGFFRYVANCGTTTIPVDSGTGRVLQGEFTNQIKSGIGTGLLQAGLPDFIVEPALDGMGQGTISSFDVENSYAVGLEWQSPLEGLRLAGSYNRTDFEADFSLAVGPDLNALGVADIAVVDRLIEQDLLNASVEYTFQDMVLALEYMRATIDAGEERATHPEGWYGMISYRFFNWLATGYSYGRYYGDRSDKKGKNVVGAPAYTAWRKQHSVFARVDINENWLIKGEYQVNFGTATLSTLDNLDENGNLDMARRWGLFAMKMTYNF